METVLKVEGMSCDHCKTAVTNGLKEIQGVTEVEVNLKEKEVTIQHNETVKVEAIKEAIEEQGYDVISS